MKSETIGIYEDDLGNRYSVIVDIKQTTAIFGDTKLTRDGAKSYRTSSGIGLNRSNNGFTSLNGMNLTLISI